MDDDLTDGLYRLGRRLYLAFDDGPARVAATIPIDEISKFVRAARRQADRLAVALQRANASAPLGERLDAEAVEDAAVDAYFLFVCWHRVERMLFDLKKRHGFAAPVAVYDRHAGELLRHAEARHAITHIEDRMPGRANAAKIPDEAEHWSIGRIAPAVGFFMVGAEVYDLSPANVHRLEAIVGDLVAELGAELDALGVPFPEEPE